MSEHPHLWYIEDDNGYAALTYRNGPKAGQTYSFASKREAEEYLDRIHLDRGIYQVTDVEPYPQEDAR